MVPNAIGKDAPAVQADLAQIPVLATTNPSTNAAQIDGMVNNLGVRVHELKVVGNKRCDIVVSLTDNSEALSSSATGGRQRTSGCRTATGRLNSARRGTRQNCSMSVSRLEYSTADTGSVASSIVGKLPSGNGNCAGPLAAAGTAAETARDDDESLGVSRFFFLLADEDEGVFFFLDGVVVLLLLLPLEGGEGSTVAVTRLSILSSTGTASTSMAWLSSSSSTSS